MEQIQTLLLPLSSRDGGGALCKYQPGRLIIAGRTGPGHCYNTTKEGETCESGPMIPIH